MRRTVRIADGARAAAANGALPLGLGLTMLALHLAGPGAFDALVLERDALYDEGALWRAVSAHFVHWNSYHLGTNLAALAAWQLLCPVSWSFLQWLAALFLQAIVISLAILWLAPELQRYAGFSGILHGLFLIGLTPRALAGDSLSRLCLAYLLVKVVIEQVAGALFSDAARIGAQVATDAHMAGIGAGGLVLAGSCAWRHWTATPAKVPAQSKIADDDEKEDL